MCQGCLCFVNPPVKEKKEGEEMNLRLASKSEVIGLCRRQRIEILYLKKALNKIHNIVVVHKWGLPK